MTERTRSRVQAAEMSFLRRVAGVSLRDRVRSSVIREELGLEPLLLYLERSQLRWFGHLSWSMWPGKGKSGAPCLSCSPRDPTPDKRMTMNKDLSLSALVLSRE
ncbi:unnamed protein product [Pleuronectes platessa]|uniref:Uncharacterized protein n=1 Tax=Pleuronectes platessa TaxID=8262 RepID=A0A9N7TQH2_PLEPL|nr:unnamed protein product [Pleuronectes platessa]